MKAQIVSLNCILKNRLGKVISSSYCNDVLTSAPQEGMLRGLSKALVNLKSGEHRKISISAGDAYGYYDPKLVMVCSRDQFPSRLSLKLGQALEVDDGDGNTVKYRVSEISHERITLDANHPLAGQDLVFEIETVSARDATPEEVSGAVSEEDLLQVNPTPLLYAN